MVKISIRTKAQDEAEMAGFVAVPLKTLGAVEIKNLDLFVLKEDDSTPTLCCKAGDGGLSKKIKDFSSDGANELYLQSEDYAQFLDNIQGNLGDLLNRQDIPLVDRFQVLQIAVSEGVEKAFQNVQVDRAVKESQRVGEHLIQTLNGGNAVPTELFDVMKHDYCTFTHLVNVSSYCLLLAERLGIRNEEEQLTITTGAMLHDVGKRLIPTEILNKPGPLTDEEYEVVKAHPAKGYEELCKRDDVNFEQLMMVYQHHEKLDGSGYPVGVTGDDIHPMARLCAVVDVFDAMTSRRPYRKPAKVAEVLGYLNSIAGTHLDKEMVTCWTAAMQES